MLFCLALLVLRLFLFVVLSSFSFPFVHCVPVLIFQPHNHSHQCILTQSSCSPIYVYVSCFVRVLFWIFFATFRIHFEIVFFSLTTYDFRFNYLWFPTPPNTVLTNQITSQLPDTLQIRSHLNNNFFQIGSFTTAPYKHRPHIRNLHTTPITCSLLYNCVPLAIVSTRPSPHNHLQIMTPAHHPPPPNTTTANSQGSHQYRIARTIHSGRWSVAKHGCIQTTSFLDGNESERIACLVTGQQSGSHHQGNPKMLPCYLYPYPTRNVSLVQQRYLHVNSWFIS